MADFARAVSRAVGKQKLRGRKISKANLCSKKYVPVGKSYAILTEVSQKEKGRGTG